MGDEEGSLSPEGGKGDRQRGDRQDIRREERKRKQTETLREAERYIEENIRASVSRSGGF